MKKLFDQFPPVSVEAWKKKVINDLKGADFETSLVWKTGEGFDLMPLYRSEDVRDNKYYNSLPGQFPYLRGNKCCDNSWKIRQNIIVSDYAEANKKALDLLMKGVDSPGFYIPDPDTITKGNIHNLLKDIHPEAVELNFLPDGRARELADFFISFLREGGYDPKSIKAFIETDPLGRLFQNGTLCVPVEEAMDYLADVTRSAAPYPGLHTLQIDASRFRNAGAGIVLELALGISMGAEYLSQLTDRGIGVDEAATRIRFSFATGSDYFPEIAKLRTARLLWSAVVSGFNPDNLNAAIMEIHSTTGRWNKSADDPFTNLLRTQTEAMAAILGGTDSLTVDPYDTIFKQPDEFSERLARNQQLILRDEAYFDKVADPSAGCWYIESITDVLADKAWNLFLELEETGGFLESMNRGIIHNKIKEFRERNSNDTSKFELEITSEERR